MSDNSSTYAITGIKAGVTTITVPLRLEVDSWYPAQTAEHIKQNSLFFYALRSLQQRDPEKKLSFFQIAGIHGLPFQPWDEDTDAQTANEGYCTHDSLLFPCWHRPYMLLFEQLLYEIMIKQVIPKLPESMRKDWTDAASTFRLPYWDWAQKKDRDGNSIYDVPMITKQPRIDVIDLKDGVTIVTIPNPMFKFTMPNDERMGCEGVYDVQDTTSKGKIVTIPFSKSRGTSRWAPYQPESATVTAEWMDGKVDNSKVADALNGHPWYGKDVDNVPIAEMVYRLYLPDYISSFTQFATTKYRPGKDAPSAYLSLEYIHNNIHNWTGGFDNYIGHMTEVPVAAFDPIFYMHHANVDRQFAIWQALNVKNNEKNWFEKPAEQLEDDGTWSIKTNTVDTPETPLAPFHTDTKGTYYISNDIRDWMKLGYSYPELQPWLDKYKKDGKFNLDLYLADIKYQLKKLYSPAEFEATEDDTDAGDATTATATAATAGVRLISGPGYNSWTKHVSWKNDYIINVTYNRFALNGIPYTLYFFIGPKSELNNYSGPLHESKYHVGFVYNFSNPVYRNRAAPGCKNCRRKAAEGTRSRGQLPITGALIARIQAQEAGGGIVAPGTVPPHGLHHLPNLESHSVEEYLKTHLHWSVRTHGGETIEIPNDDPFVEVTVYHRDARFDNFTSPAQYERLEKATKGKPGGFGFPE